MISPSHTRENMAEQNSTEGYYPSTPLDLLLNVISGSDGHGYPSENVEREGVVHSEGEVDPQLSLSGLLESSRPTVRLRSTAMLPC